MESYPVVCKWCQAKGIRKVIDTSPAEHSDGICEECAAELLGKVGIADCYKAAARRHPCFTGIMVGIPLGIAFWTILGLIWWVFGG